MSEIKSENVAKLKVFHYLRQMFDRMQEVLPEVVSYLRKNSLCLCLIM